MPSLKRAISRRRSAWSMSASDQSPARTAGSQVLVLRAAVQIGARLERPRDALALRWARFCGRR